jgi:hypothetical protein
LILSSFAICEKLTHLTHDYLTASSCLSWASASYQFVSSWPVGQPFLRQISFALSAICWYVGPGALSVLELTFVFGDAPNFSGSDKATVRSLRPADVVLLLMVLVPDFLFVLVIFDLLSILYPNKPSVLKNAASVI